MKEAASQTLFGVLASALADFRSQVEGEAGEQIRPLGNSQGPIPELVRTTLGGIGEALEWLYKAAKEGERHIIGADAAIAALEVLADGVEGLGEGIDFGDAPALFGVPPEPFEKVGEKLVEASNFMDRGLELTRILPRPEELRAIQTEAQDLLGHRVNPDLIDPETGEPVPGSLGDLLTEIAAIKT